MSTELVMAALVVMWAQALVAVWHAGRFVRLRYAITALASAAIVLASAGFLLNGAAAEQIRLPLGLPDIGMRFRLDALSAFFLIVVNTGAGAASLYGMGYGVHEKRQGRVMPFYPAFIAGMTMVVLADDAFTFLISWEIMSLTSWALVMSNSEKETHRAGLVYFIMASFSAIMLVFIFGLLAGASGNYGFDEIRRAQPGAVSAGIILVLVLLGPGSKAGLFPLHVWLPLAHPAAPSHVSALMSGVMTKVAIYGAIRILFDLVGANMLWWWAAPVLVVGAATALMGILYALMQSDLKRLLAYSTVENVGIIFVGLGLGLAFQANGLHAAAALALSAALLHVFNHALFKSLLFMGAGAVLHATGTRDMDKLGGLIHKMRITAVFFLVGAIAISALPPLNGFVSEWLTFQSVLASPDLPQASLKFLIPVVGAALALAAALAGAAFVKAFGVSFLGRARSAAAADAGETDRFSLLAMALLAGMCLVIGVMPTLAVEALGPVVDMLTTGSLPPQSTGPAPLSLVPFADGRSSYNGMIIMAFLLISGVATAWFIHRFASAKVSFGEAWDCGTPDDTPLAQYTAESFSQPLQRVYGTAVFQAQERVDMPPPGALRPAHHSVESEDPAWRFVMNPVTRLLWRITRRTDILQRLTIRQYLAIVFAWLVMLLVAGAIWH